jgi:hypothetical protein
MPTARFRMAANASVASDTPNGASSSSSARSGGTVAGFHPTVISLMLLVVAEYSAYVYFRHYFRHAHGG